VQFVCRISADGGVPVTSDRLSVGAAKMARIGGGLCGVVHAKPCLIAPSKNGRREKPRRPPATKTFSRESRSDP
jgi:hypothetical protein